MEITHRQTRKRVILEEYSLAAGYRERIYLAATIAQQAGRFAYGQIVSGHYNPRTDMWYTDAGNFEVRVEGAGSQKLLDELGFDFQDRV